MTLTIGFDATAAARQWAGIGRYTRQLLGALARDSGDIRYRVFYWSAGASKNGLPALDSRFTVRPLPLSDRLANAIWQRARLPIPVELAIGRFDVFHSPDFTLPPTLARPTVLTIHDLAFLRVPNCAYPTLRAYLQKVVPRSARRATRLIAVSDSTRRDLIELLDIPPERITTVVEGVSESFRPPSDMDDARFAVSQAGVNGPFILTAGTLEPRKNYVRLLEAYALLRGRGVEHVLVIAGRPGWMYQPIYEAVQRLSLTPYVTFLQPSDTLLAALYGMADAFVFPSLYEGFGIPPLEAMACGAPVACSDSSSLPEVVGDSALLFSPLEVDAIADSVSRILSEPETARRLRLAGPRRAASFTWERAARQTSDVYRAVLGDA
ncbi:MAG TPA: glycosyltransferase family 1 protein [Chloroflexota bacterium]